METEIKWLPTKNSKPCQIYSTGLEFCFINDEKEQCHEFVYCKDFLQDAIHAFLNDRVATIYSFKYDPKKMPALCLAQTLLGVCNAQDKDFMSKIPNVLDILNQIESKLKLKKSKISICSNPPKAYKTGVVLIQGSSRWQEAAPMISLYTLLIRLGFVHKKGVEYEKTFQSIISGKTKPYQTYDADYLKSSKKSIDKILDKGYRKIFYSDIKRNYPSDLDIDMLHDDCGIVGLATGDAKHAVPGWFKSKKKKVVKTNEQVVAETLQPIDCF